MMKKSSLLLTILVLLGMAAMLSFAAAKVSNHHHPTTTTTTNHLDDDDGTKVSPPVVAPEMEAPPPEKGQPETKTTATSKPHNTMDVDGLRERIQQEQATARQLLVEFTREHPSPATTTTKDGMDSSSLSRANVVRAHQDVLTSYARLMEDARLTLLTLSEDPRIAIGDSNKDDNGDNGNVFNKDWFRLNAKTTSSILFPKNWDDDKAEDEASELRIQDVLYKSAQQMEHAIQIVQEISQTMQGGGGIDGVEGRGDKPQEESPFRQVVHSQKSQSSKELKDKKNKKKDGNDIENDPGAIWPEEEDLRLNNWTVYSFPEMRILNDQNNETTSINQNQESTTSRRANVRSDGTIDYQNPGGRNKKKAHGASSGGDARFQRHIDMANMIHEGDVSGIKNHFHGMLYHDPRYTGHGDTSGAGTKTRRRLQNGVCQDVSVDALDRCDELIGCYQRMSAYDKLLYFFEDGIDEDTGEVQEDIPREWNDAREDFEGKLERIDDIISQINQGNKLSNCNRLLDEFHRNEEEGRTYTWEAGTVSNVCRAVGSQGYVKFEFIKNAPYYFGGDQTRADCLSDLIFTELVRCTQDLFESRGSVHQEEKFVWTSSSNGTIDIPVDFKNEAFDEHGFPTIAAVRDSNVMFRKDFITFERRRCRTDRWDPPGKSADRAMQLTFGDTPSVGLVCAFAKDAVQTGETEEIFPGYCCLDRPERSDVWGTKYSCDQPCEQRAPFFSGFSESACDIWSGTYCRYERSCQKLLDDVKVLDDEAKAAGRTVFSGYLNDAPTVNDPKDFFECGRLREYFGFDADYPIDEDITAELERLQCIPDFEDFEDLVRDGGSDSTLVETKCSRFLEEPGTSAYTDQEMRRWERLNFGLEQVLEFLDFALSLVDAQECPTADGANQFCISIKNGLIVASAVALEIAKKTLAVSERTFGELATLSDYNIGEIYFQIMVVYDNQVETLCKLVDSTEAVKEQVNENFSLLSELSEQLYLNVSATLLEQSMEIQTLTNTVKTQITTQLTESEDNIIDSIDETTTNILNEIEDFTTTTLELLQKAKDAITSLIEQSTSDIRDDIAANRNEIVDLINATLKEDGKFAGCNGRDEDLDQAADNCEEDMFPPEAILNVRGDSLRISDDGMISVPQKSFDSIESAMAFIKSRVSVVDDCASSSDLELRVSSVGGSCESTMFTATSVHASSCGEKIGNTLSFKMDVDETVPIVTCGFVDGVVDGRTLILEEDDEMVNTELFFRVLETCADVNVKVDVKSNEYESPNSMVGLVAKVSKGENEQAYLAVDPEKCSTKKGKGSRSTCISDSSTFVRFYDVKIEATTSAGVVASDTCRIIISPDKLSKSDGSRGARGTRRARRKGRKKGKGSKELTLEDLLAAAEASTQRWDVASLNLTWKV